MPNKLSDRSRKMMQDALLQLLREKDFSKIAFADISRKSGLARRTFYYHFDTKEDLFVSLVDDIMAPIFEELNAIISSYLFTADTLEPMVHLLKVAAENRENG